MLKFLGASPDGPVIGLGLSKRNVELLQQGNPVHVELADLKLKGHIIIFYGDTEDDMRRMLEEVGLVDENTPRVDKRGSDA